MFYLFQGLSGLSTKFCHHEKYIFALTKVWKNANDTITRRTKHCDNRHVEHSVRNKFQGRRREGILYADAIRNKPRYQNRDENSIRGQEEPQKDNKKGGVQKEASIHITISKEEMSWAKKGFVGCVCNFEDIPLLQQKLTDEGIVTVKIIPLRGEKVFIKIDEGEDFGELLKDSSQFFNKWFSVVKEWETRYVASVRFTLCRIYGVLVHAWRQIMFSLLTASFGSLIKMDPNTENM